MAVRVLVVSLDDNSELNVDQSGRANEFCRSDEPYDVQFVLSGTRLGGAEFCHASGDPPAFQWVDAPPPGVFPVMKLQTKRMLKLLNVNAGNYSVGVWKYQLSVRRGSTVFQTKYDGDAPDVPDDGCVEGKETDDLLYSRAVNNPIIINR